MITGRTPLQFGKIARMTNLCLAVLLTTISSHSINCFREGAMSESDSVSVCPGGQLMLSCIDDTNNTTTLQWNVTVFPPSYLDPRESGVRLFTKTSGFFYEEPITINQMIINFSLTSNSPLKSVVSVVNVSNSLNQTRIECTDDSGAALLVTSIHVIGNEANPQPTISITDEQFGPNNVSVTLKWVQKGVTFSSVHPPADLRLTGNMSAQLTIPYDVQHSVSIAVCSQPPIKVAELYYATCKDPGLVDDSLAVINYTPPAIEGSNITIKCSVNENSTADNHTLMCTNGQWEPNLGHIPAGCKGTGGEGPTTTDRNNQVTHELDRTAVLGGAIGASLLILVAGITVLFIVILVKKSSLCSHKPPNLSYTQRSNQQITRNNLGNQYLGEYSEVTLSPQDTVEVQPRTVVYADLGPLSIEKRKPFPCASILDDDRIEYAQLNTRLSAKEVQKSRAHREDITCIIALDLDSLLIQLQPEVNEKWYQFGEAIGIEKEILDKYLSYPPDQNLIEVCDYWLRNHTGQPTWNEVATALKQIGFQRLGYGIERVYETGRLPKEVNMNAVNIEPDPFVDENEEPPPIPPRLM